jgi:hypothetical protein
MDCDIGVCVDFCASTVVVGTCVTIVGEGVPARGEVGVVITKGAAVTSRGGVLGGTDVAVAITSTGGVIVGVPPAIGVIELGLLHPQRITRKTRKPSTSITAAALTVARGPVRL